ncbi:GAF sensor signal transduction histidine kinase [Halothece sp. PCC 7418]|uniref:DICT sensory domain-containing protein n=1 Tax=Halothece sp. (strain PCC 7418) TaxID=65093 RepID=UPI0002A05EDB|nr:DICT sensory domain-containing protein [Halothece sp. PCC 7418]AFZ44417.1 GAF sensor signal transduction histidine kinase [Halothece sp. PCC 7418]
MHRSTSLVTELLGQLPHLRTQIYFKSSLTALSHAMEDQVFATADPPLVIASFQQERFYRQEAHRYRRLGEKSDHIYIFCGGNTSFEENEQTCTTINFAPDDVLAQEWHLTVISKTFTSCLICRECAAHDNDEAVTLDSARRFEGIWTFDAEVTKTATALLFQKILSYRPELQSQIEAAQQYYLSNPPQPESSSEWVNPDAFVERLVTHLQAGQYRVIRAYSAIAKKEEKERLLRSLTNAIRQSLDLQEILEITVQEVGEALAACRCLVYRCRPDTTTATIEHEFLRDNITSVENEIWPVKNNPLLQNVREKGTPIYIKDTGSEPTIQNNSLLSSLVDEHQIYSWLFIPLLYQGQVIGMIELHHCYRRETAWTEEDIELVEAIAPQIGLALTQAEAYTNLETLNEQLEALEQTRSNLVAITGHELRTPLSTIQVCLESLVSEPDMSEELRQVMLSTALNDAERMRRLVQDFLTLSRLESGRIEWNPEPMSVEECIELSLSNIRGKNTETPLPEIENQAKTDLPLTYVDGEWLVEVLAKLLDNACKFTDNTGKIILSAEPQNQHQVKVTVSDTGRGIEPSRLETVFDRFYQEEGALQRTTGGTGLGLAICRQIVEKWGGEIWAESTGKNQGTQFHFTIPIAKEARVKSTVSQ